VPYHIGNGWGGGLVPFITSAAFLSTGSVGRALIYPIAVPRCVSSSACCDAGDAPQSYLGSAKALLLARDSLPPGGVLHLSIPVPFQCC